MNHTLDHTWAPPLKTLRRTFRIRVVTCGFLFPGAVHSQFPVLLGHQLWIHMLIIGVSEPKVYFLIYFEAFFWNFCCFCFWNPKNANFTSAFSFGYTWVQSPEDHIFVKIWLIESGFFPALTLFLCTRNAEMFHLPFTKPFVNIFWFFPAFVCA